MGTRVDSGDCGCHRAAGDGRRLFQANTGSCVRELRRVLELEVEGSGGAGSVLACVSSREAVRSLLFRTILVVLWALRHGEAELWLRSWRGTGNTETRGELEGGLPWAGPASR